MGIVNRWYDILDLLLARERLIVDDLEEKLQMTPYTIKNNIQLLNNELEGVAKIEQQNKYYYLNIYDFEKLEQIMSGSFKKNSDFNSSSKRIAYILGKLILVGGYHIITDFAEELSVSRNTVNNDLKTARKLISHYNLQIESRTSKGIILEGETLDKRMAYMNLVQDYFNYRFITEEAINQVTQILSKYQINKETTNHVIKAIDLLAGAIKTKEFLTEPIPYFMNTAQEAEVFIEITNFFESYYSISLSQYELDFLSFPFNLTNLNQKNCFIQKNAGYLPEVFNYMVQNIESSFVIDLNWKKLYTEISNHLFYLLNRAVFYISPKEMFFGEVEEKYPFSYQIATVAAEAVGNKINRSIDSIEIDYLTLYFEMGLRSRSSQTSLNVAIISNTGHGTVNLIQKQIDSVLGEGTSFTRFTEVNYLEADLSNFFVIFTTIPLKNPPSSVPVIRISNILSEQWLSKELEKVISTNPNLINQVLDEIYLLDETKDYLSNLGAMMKSMQEKGLIGDTFKNRIIKREEKQTTIFNNGVAFPHEVNPEMGQIILSIGIFNERYEVENREIKVVFLLAVPEKLTPDNELKLLELYDLIFRLASDSSFKKEMSFIHNRSEFIEYLEDRRLDL